VILSTRINKRHLKPVKSHFNELRITDYKNLSIEEPMSLEAKIVHGAAFVVVWLAVVLGLLL